MGLTLDGVLQDVKHHLRIISLMTTQNLDGTIGSVFFCISCNVSTLSFLLEANVPISA